jgi:DNA gyrase/topoisomerase IV subunit B
MVALDTRVAAVEARISGVEAGIGAKISALKESIEARAFRFGNASIQRFANTERTTNGGTHVKGLLAGLSSGLTRAAPELAPASNASSKPSSPTISQLFSVKSRSC